MMFPPEIFYWPSLKSCTVPVEQTPGQVLFSARLVVSFSEHEQMCTLNSTETLHSGDIETHFWLFGYTKYLFISCKVCIIMISEA